MLTPPSPKRKAWADCGKVLINHENIYLFQKKFYSIIYLIIMFIIHCRLPVYHWLKQQMLSLFYRYLIFCCCCGCCCCCRCQDGFVEMLQVLCRTWAGTPLSTWLRSCATTYSKNSSSAVKSWRTAFRATLRRRWRPDSAQRSSHRRSTSLKLALWTLQWGTTAALSTARCGCWCRKVQLLSTKDSYRRFLVWSAGTFACGSRTSSSRN